MGLQQFLILAIRGWWIIALSVVVTTTSTAFFVSQQAPIYRASTTIELIPHVDLSARDVVDVYGLLDKRNLSNTLARKAEGASMAQVAAARLGVDDSLIRDAEVSALVLPDSNIIEIQATSTNRDLAAAICNTIAEEMLGQAPNKILQIEPIDAATPPSSPITPQPARMIMLAVVSGLALGIIFVLLEHILRIQARRGAFGGWRPEGTLPVGTEQ
jgi:capsular polysaccharide biosynthesis protein